MATLANSFETAQEMSTHQEQRELAEALRVQAMLPFERSRWLASTWGTLQRQALSFHQDLASADGGTARHFATPDTKNQFDEQRETERALRLALSRNGAIFDCPQTPARIRPSRRSGPQGHADAPLLDAPA